MKSSKTLAVISLGIVIGIAVGSYASYVFYYRNVFCPNETVTLFDRAYFTYVDRLLRSANSTIDIAMFELKYYPTYPDSHENELVNDLIDASERGVKVRAIVDEYDRHANDTISLLRSHGIDAKLDEKNITTHVKIIIIDGKIVVVGSTNWSYYALEKNHEASVVIYSKDVARRFEEYFSKIWRE